MTDIAVRFPMPQKQAIDESNISADSALSDSTDAKVRLRCNGFCCVAAIEDRTIVWIDLDFAAHDFAKSRIDTARTIVCTGNLDEALSEDK
jgi:hypothetical protein